MMQLSNEDFTKLVNFIKVNYGINLEQKQQLIVGRLSASLELWGFKDFSEYVNHITSNKNPTDIDNMLSKITTNYTFFMREEKHFEYLKNSVLPWVERVKTDKSVNIWCAGCATGQEAYTLSIILKEYFSGKGAKWDTRVLATDISKSALDACNKAMYPADSIEVIPEKWRNKYFKKTNIKDIYTVTDEIKSNVIFRPFNLMDPINFKVKFDIIFCRNVMIYFDKQTKEAIVNRFCDAMVKDGYLFIGHSENISDCDTNYHYLMPAVYRK